MITNPEESLAYFDSIHRRTERDIAALPPAAENWAPPAGEGDQGWSIADIVHHIAESRIFFANAYRGEGWIYNWPVPMADGQSSWLPGLEASVAEFHQRINSTPKEWLTRRVAMLDSDGTLSGWRILMMLLEHEVHHRSQIDTYAGLQGWDVPQIYGRYREQVESMQGEQKRLLSGS